MGKNAKLKERQKWSHEKPQLHNARKLRGIYFIDPKDKEFKETINNARKKLETPVAPAMPFKISKTCKLGVARGKTNDDHIAGKGHKFILMPQAMKIPAAKAAVDKELENWRKFRRGT